MKGYGLYYNLTAAALCATVNKLPPLAELELRAAAAGVAPQRHGSVAIRRRPASSFPLGMPLGRPPGSGNKLSRKAAEGKLGLRW